MAEPREQFNCRLPAFTKAQIAELSRRLGLSQSEVVMMAVDRLAVATESRDNLEPRSGD